jgi:hypothetical protein
LIVISSFHAGPQQRHQKQRRRPRRRQQQTRPHQRLPHRQVVRAWAPLSRWQIW